jgi:hypothetical protein
MLEMGKSPARDDEEPASGFLLAVNRGEYGIMKSPGLGIEY